jgi:hypothetical protein
VEALWLIINASRKVGRFAARLYRYSIRSSLINYVTLCCKINLCELLFLFFDEGLLQSIRGPRISQGFDGKRSTERPSKSSALSPTSTQWRHEYWNNANGIDVS